MSFIQQTFLFAALLGALLSLLLPLKFKSRLSLLLSGITLIFSMSMAFFTQIWSGGYTELPFFFQFSFGFILLTGPLFYLTHKHEKAFTTWKNWLHFIPFPVFCIWYTTGSYIFWLEMLLTLQLLVYSFLVIRKPIHLWLKWSFVLYSTAYILYEIIFWTGSLELIIDYWLVAIMAASIYSLFFHAFLSSQLFKSAKRRYKNGNSRSNQMILKKIEHYLTSERAYLNPDLKIGDVSTALGFSINQISESINSVYESYNDMINRYRIEVAKELLIHSNEKVLSVALSSGFNNKVTFSNAFKKYEGCTPSFYRRSNRVISSS